MAETIMAPPGATANKRSVEEKLRLAIDQAKAAMDAMDLIRAKANADVGPGDIKDIARAVKDLARVSRYLVRDALDNYTSVE